MQPYLRVALVVLQLNAYLAALGRQFLPASNPIYDLTGEDAYDYYHSFQRYHFPLHPRLVHTEQRCHRLYRFHLLKIEYTQK